MSHIEKHGLSDRSLLQIWEHFSDGVALAKPDPWRIVFANASLGRWLNCRDVDRGALQSVEDLCDLTAGQLSGHLELVWRGEIPEAVVAGNLARRHEDQVDSDVEVRIVRVELDAQDFAGIVIRPLGLPKGHDFQQRRDPLTDLADRSFLLSRLNLLLTGDRCADQQFAVLFVDVDGFKAVNDRFGHLAGDRVLVEMARRLADSVRTGDRVVRYGGDEFVVLVERVLDRSEIEQIIDRIHTAMAPPFALPGGEVNLSVSIGAATASSDFKTPESILAEADFAMYSARRQNAASCK